jgi:hypothetical protein
MAPKTMTRMPATAVRLTASCRLSANVSCMKKKDIAIGVEVAISRKSRDPSSQMKLRSRRMSVPTPRARCAPRAPVARDAWSAVAHAGHGQQHRHQLDRHDHEDGRARVAEGRGRRNEDRPATGPEQDHQPHQAAGEADLACRHEVRHVALERALREIRAELEEDVEDQEADPRARGRSRAGRPCRRSSRR